MRTKDNTVEVDLHPTLTSLLFHLNELYIGWDAELVITSGSESSARHSFTSLHYARPGQAVDVRTWGTNNVPDANTQYKVLVEAKNDYCIQHDIPNNWFDIILESHHIHIEYQPKRKELN